MFLVSAVLGLATAHSLTSLLGLPIASTESADASAQKNVVVIHVNDLEAKSPQLISVWSSFTVVNEQTYITMTPLYPSIVPDPASSRLVETFKLNNRKKPSKHFLETLEVYRIDWSGYIVVDTQGMQEMRQWMMGDGELNLSDVGTDPTAFLQDETMLLNGICQGLNGIGPAPDECLEWEGIYPAHLETDLSMQRVLAYWRGVNETGSPVICNIFID